VFNRSKRVTKIAPPVAVDPISQRPYGQPTPERDEHAEAEIAAGQRALAAAVVPPAAAATFRPNTGWAGARG